ncbi:protein phosphatase 2C domain-containing protein [Alteromonadaceae bacterium BrNp21-10]|nr:protein phosphatase 2C domain-containing protein [Alteromonadaceae bacterium BrNp21-10]
MLKQKWVSSARTDIGTVRKINEDDFLDASEVAMWCVADGMGGHQKGDVASRMICDYLKCLATPESYPITPTQVKERINQVNERLIALADTQPESSVIGSTVVVLVFDQQSAHCIWAGDSRIYRLRQNQLTRLTRDHSQVEELVEAGLLSAEDAESHPAANVITRAVGAHEELDLDVISVPLQQGDIFLLCSDGLNKVMNDNEIAEYLISHSLDALPELFIQTALERNARDNVTALTVKYDGVATDGIAPNSGSPSLDDTLPLVR